MSTLSEEQRRAIATTAASLYERLRAFGDSPASGPPERLTAEVIQALKDWNKAFSSGDTAAFERRLEWDSLDPNTVASALTAWPERVSPEAMAWTHRLPLIIAEAEALGCELDRGETIPELEGFATAAGLPFLEILVPLLRTARQALLAGNDAALRTMTLPVLAAFERQLLEDAGKHAAMALHEAFRGFIAEGDDATVADSTLGVEATSRPDSNYVRFVRTMLAGGLAAFFIDYPVLSLHLVTLAETWIETTAEILSRLEADRAAISERFAGGRDPGALTGIETGLSDRHDGGRRVAVLGFESGLKLVYKPRDMGLEATFNELIAWTVAEGLEPRQKALQVHAGDGYGWVEYVAQGEFDSRDAVGDYYRKAGGLLCIAWLLRAQDLHMENLVATTAGPVLVDTEMLLQPEVDQGDSDGAPGVIVSTSDRVAESCIGTGLLTLLRPGLEGGLRDIGGLRGAGGHRSPLPRRRWHDVGTDLVHCVNENIFVPAFANEVRLGGSLQAPEQYADEVRDGFARTYRFVLERRSDLLDADGPLARFAMQRVRVLFRNTDHYSALLQMLAAPRYQRSGTTRSFTIDALNRVFSFEIDQPLLWALVTDERRALDQLDIPLFSVTASSATLVSEDGRQANGYVRRSGMAAVEGRLRSLSPEDLAAQVELLEWSLASPLGARFQSELHAPSSAPADASAPGTAEAEGLVAHAVWIGEELLARAERCGTGLEWPLPEILRRHGEREGMDTWSLYDGAGGLALFLAALGASTGDERWRAVAEDAGRPMWDVIEAANGDDLTVVHGIGACKGLGSIIYAATLIGRLSGTDSFIELAERASHHLSRESLTAASSPDVVDGVAGAILALLALHEETGDARLLDLARAAGDHLLATKIEGPAGGAAWPVRGLLLAGFAHGAAGIGCALARLATITGEDAYGRAAARAYHYERSLFSAQQGNWRILRPGSRRPQHVVEFMTAWCHGAPGIGLARALSLDVVRNQEILGEIEVAMRTTIELRGDEWDHLCCGGLGRADALLTVGTRLGSRVLVEAAHTVANTAMRRAAENGHFNIPSTPFEHRIVAPGFFQGVSGIGYQLLRLSDPQTFPSVLGFEATPTKPLD